MQSQTQQQGGVYGYRKILDTVRAHHFYPRPPGPHRQSPAGKDGEGRDRAVIGTAQRNASSTVTVTTQAASSSKASVYYFNRCLGGHREEKRSSVAGASTVGLKGEREPIFEKRVLGTSTYVVSSKKYTWLQYKKRSIQAPGTTFSTFSDEVRLEGEHGNCCRFATLTGANQRAHIRLNKLWFKGQVRS